MVDTALGLHLCLKVIECAVLGKADACCLIAVLQDARPGKDAVDLIPLVDIKVACQYHRTALCYLSDSFHDKKCPLTAGNNTHMIHVKIEEIESTI